MALGRVRGARKEHMRTLFSALHTHHEQACLFGPGRVWRLKGSKTSLKNWFAQCGERAQDRIGYIEEKRRSVEKHICVFII